MHFANFTFSVRAIRLMGKVADWPLSWRFTFLVLPAGIVITLIATWIGYRAASSTLMDSLEVLPMLEAKIQAASMGKTLKQLRRSLFRIAQDPGSTEQSFRARVAVVFQENEEVIEEIGYKGANGETFLLLRDTAGFVPVPASDMPRSPYSPFQHLTSMPLQPGQATLYPIVYFDAHYDEGQQQKKRDPVMRMALSLPDGRGVVMAGINVARWCDELSFMMQPDSELRLPVQAGAVQLSFFFDLRGWILFEMHGAGSKKYLPDTSRQGYGGDLGRTGYDAAFRPWSVHENYWRMVTDVVDGRSGSVSAPADKYTPTQIWASGIQCYAPVLFAPADDQEPAPIGGIAFFETSSLPLSAFLRLANYSLGIMVATILLFSLLSIRVGKKLALPFRRMVFELADMTDKGEIGFLGGETASQEQQKLQAAVNSLISTTMITQTDLQRLSREMELARSRVPVDLHQSIGRPKPESEFDLVGSSALIREVRKQVHKAAKAGTDVLVWGETGTGKELVAAAIHKVGSRSSGPYISINCGALDENLLLDTLFGHVKGAFTEAKTDRKGVFLAASGGTLHLDEIANASPKVQQALLRALSVRRLRPLGSDKEISFNTRVVAATNLDLRECVNAGTFREDLYYRLAIISIEVPPLRHRKEDIPELASFCISEAALALGRHEAHLSRGALDIMTAYDWPGNVREFKNCITRALAFAEGDLILPQHITLEPDAARNHPKTLLSGPSMERASPGRAGNSIPSPHPARQTVYGNSLPGSADKNESDGNRVKKVSHAAEYLWPAPPRENFTPARLEPSNADRSAAANTRPAVVPGTAPPDADSPPQGAQSKPRQGAAAGSAWAHASSGLNERQIRALALIRHQGGITRAEYEAAAGGGLSSRTAQNDLRELVERGILARVGAGPGTRYVPRTE